MSEPKEKNKFPWAKLIIWLLVLTGVGVGMAAIFGAFNKKAHSIDQIRFENRLKNSSADVNDGTYFKSLEINKMSNTIEGIYLKEGSKGDTGSKSGQHFIAHVSGSYIDNLTSTAINSNAVGSSLNIGLQKDLKNSVLNGSIKGYINPTGPKGRSIWIDLLFSLLPIMLMLGLFFWIFRRSRKGSGGGSAFDPTNGAGNSRAVRMKSNKKFSDIAGLIEAKEEVMEVVDFLKNPKKYTQAGASIPKGILLGGPPGTGKTLLAKAVAGESGVPFYFISGSHFVEMFAGVGAKRVREMFKVVRKHSPSILFIDELDAIGKKRGSSFGNDEREQTLNQILVELDGMQENSGILVMGATNRPDDLDPALVRPGRFDRSITINLPDVKEREAILELHSKGKRISKEVNFKKLARRTYGFSGAQLNAVINESALLSVREQTDIITREQVDEAVDRVVAGPAKKHRVVSKKQMEVTAYHEAGHAVVGLIEAKASKVQKITIIPRGDAGGYTVITPADDSYTQKRSDLVAQIMGFMGGRAVEKIIYNEVSTGASDDIQKASNISRRMVTEFGMSQLGPIAYETRSSGSKFLGGGDVQKNYSDAIAKEIDLEIRKILNEAESYSIKILKKNMDLVELIKDELLENEIIVAEQIEYIFKNKKRPSKKIAVKKENIKEQSLDDLISSTSKDNLEENNKYHKKDLILKTKAEIIEIGKINGINLKNSDTKKTIINKLLKIKN
ncbi:MAG: ATP-dependent zinc metalloprotease FtsH [Mollicutes bacterium PWAP]|nr:ATP-dependent zinc metalloprotease FtsH [Mollicutes bacterium PWAP]